MKWGNPISTILIFSAKLSKLYKQLIGFTTTFSTVSAKMSLINALNRENVYTVPDPAL